MCYTSSSPRVSALDITGKTGERPARFRHCDEGRCFVTTRPTTVGEGEVAGSREPLSARRPTQVRNLSFCGEQKTCHWREKSLTSRPSRALHSTRRRQSRTPLTFRSHWYERGRRVTLTRSASCSSSSAGRARRHSDGQCRGDRTEPIARRLQNCGVTTTFARPPARVVTLNQAATEVMLVSACRIVSSVRPTWTTGCCRSWPTAYREVPVLAAKYPSREVLFAARPDFLYAAYPGAFGPAGVGSRDGLEEPRVDTYLAPAGCVDKSRPPGVTLEMTFAELRDVARIFGVTSRAETS